MRCLLRLGADPGCECLYGHTALHLAASHGLWECVWFLLEAGTDAEAQRQDRLTALTLGERVLQGVPNGKGQNSLPSNAGEIRKACHLLRLWAAETAETAAATALGGAGSKEVWECRTGSGAWVAYAAPEAEALSLARAAGAPRFVRVAAADGRAYEVGGCLRGGGVPTRWGGAAGPGLGAVRCLDGSTRWSHRSVSSFLLDLLHSSWANCCLRARAGPQGQGQGAGPGLLECSAGDAAASAAGPRPPFLTHAS